MPAIYATDPRSSKGRPAPKRTTPTPTGQDRLAESREKDRERG